MDVWGRGMEGMAWRRGDGEIGEKSVLAVGLGDGCGQGGLVRWLLDGRRCRCWCMG